MIIFYSQNFIFYKGKKKIKKIKLLKTIGCIALVATPVIVAPIIMSTSCTTTDPTPTDPTKVTSIEGMFLMQGADSIMNQDGVSAAATYKTGEVENKNAIAAIELSITMYFLINNNLTPVKYTEIKDQIDLNLACMSSTSVVGNIFDTEGDNIVVLNQKVTAIENGSNSYKFCHFTTTSGERGCFAFSDGASKLKLTYSIKGASEAKIFTVAFSKI